MTTLTDQIKIVAACRRAAAEATRQVGEIHRAFAEANKALFEQKAQCDVDMDAAEVKLRELAVAAYQADPASKIVGPGVTVKLFTVIEPYDPKMALSWALDHKLALTLHKTEFERFVKNGNVDFVGVIQEPRVQLATDLDAALKLDVAMEVQP